jgi:hypothetical protein
MRGYYRGNKMNSLDNNEILREVVINLAYNRSLNSCTHSKALRVLKQCERPAEGYAAVIAYYVHD